MNAKKIVTAGLALVMVAGISVAGTLAYLTSSDSVKNTFTVGKVAIILDEADVNLDGTYVTDKENRVDANSYKLMPGREYIKDPTVHVDDASEDAWLFVKVENGIADIEAEGETSIAAQMTANGWTAVAEADNVYAYREVVNGGDDILVFGNFTVDGSVVDTELDNYANAEINVIAYAIQADGFETSDKAWAAFAAQDLT